MRFAARGQHSQLSDDNHKWTIERVYKRAANPIWDFVDCAENNTHLRVGTEYYMISADGYLMPTKRGQQPPDVRYFGR